MTGRPMSTAAQAQELTAQAIRLLREAELIALQLPGDADSEATEHIHQSLTAAASQARGAYYALNCLERSIQDMS